MKEIRLKVPSGKNMLMAATVGIAMSFITFAGYLDINNFDIESYKIQKEAFTWALNAWNFGWIMLFIFGRYKAEYWGDETPLQDNR